jgi:hypothetical protein
MTEKSTDQDWARWSKPLTHSYENRHEILQELAYQHWEKRGRPIGSPEVDWFAAEEALRSHRLASGVELGPGEDLYCSQTNLHFDRVKPNSCRALESDTYSPSKRFDGRSSSGSI